MGAKMVDAYMVLMLQLHLAALEIMQMHTEL